MILRPSKFKSLLLFLGSTIFVAIGLIIPTTGNELLKFAAIGFFGLGVIVAIVQLLPGASYLRLTPTGFEYRAMFRGAVYKWSDVGEFSVDIIPPAPQKWVVFNFSTTYQNNYTARQLSRSLAGYEGCLPDMYSMSPDKLAALLNSWRTKYLSHSN